MPEDQDALVSRAVGGDAEALSRLLEEVGDELRRELGSSINVHYRSVLNEDDVMQVTLLEAFMRVNSLTSKTRAGFAAWLRRIAQNNLRDAVRALEADKRPDPKRRAHAPAGQSTSVALIDLLGMTYTTPSRFAATGEAVDALEKAIDQLPEDYKRVVRELDLEGKPAADVGASMGRSAGAVYMLRARAHDCLKDLMGSPSQFFSKGT